MMTDKMEIKKTIIAGEIMNRNLEQKKRLGEGLELYKQEFPENYNRMINTCKRMAAALKEDVYD